MHNFPITAFLKMTSTAIDFRTMPSNVPSLCIPRVFPNIDERRIRNVFADLDMGEIERVDIIKRTTEKGDKFNRVFIHWKRWNGSDNANQARERLLNGKEIKIVYDDPWFWKISAYREPIARPPMKRTAARISFDDDEHHERSAIRPRHDERARSPVRRPRHNERPRITEPRTPDCSPPRTREIETYGDEEREMTIPDMQPVKLIYEDVPLPPKKLNFKKKAPIVEEEGER